MIIYNATDNNSELQPFQSYEVPGIRIVTDLTLKIIREEKEIPRPRLLQKIKETSEFRRYAQSTISDYLSQAINPLELQGLIGRIEKTIEQYLTRDRLTHNQTKNVMSYLGQSNIFEYHKVKGNFGIYSIEQENLWEKIGDYVADGIGIYSATNLAVKEVLDQEKVKKFKIWYESYLEQMRTNKSIKRTEILQKDPARAMITSDYDKLLGLYDDKDSNMSDIILDRLVQDHSAQHPAAMKDYPFGLYFALSASEPEAVLRRIFDESIKSSPKQAKFSDHEDTIFNKANERLESISSIFSGYFEKGFEESYEHIETLENRMGFLTGLQRVYANNRVNGMKIHLERINARYKDSGIMRSLEEVGGDRSAREKIRQSESKGFELLKEQPTIQELLTLDFFEI